MNNFKRAKNWYSDVAATYSTAQRKNWYGDVAAAYDRTRPRYPEALISRAVELAHLPKGAQILEVGCGPGTATTPFAQLGFSMLCLEPSQVVCQLACQNCAIYPDVRIENTSFEEWELEPGRFNAVLAATAWHWVAPEIGYAKAAATMQPNGSLILLWNMTPQPTYEISQALHDVYQIHAPALGAYEARETQEAVLRGFEQNVLDSGRFHNLVSEQVACETTYAIDDYLLLLSTLSPYILLDPKTRSNLFTELKCVLQKISGSSLRISYLSALQIFKKLG